MEQLKWLHTSCLLKYIITAFANIIPWNLPVYTISKHSYYLLSIKGNVLAKTIYIEFSKKWPVFKSHKLFSVAPYWL